jgi:hypothetical protein
MTVVIDRTLNGGTQVVHRFENNFGASVVRHNYSYGSEEGLFELAVLQFFNDSNEYELTYNTEITDDVLGHLTQEDVESLLDRIEKIGTKPSYAMTKLEEELKIIYKRISMSEEEKESLEKRIEDENSYLKEKYENAKDLEQTITQLKGETK